MGVTDRIPRKKPAKAAAAAKPAADPDQQTMTQLARDSKNMSKENKAMISRAAAATIPAVVKNVAAAAVKVSGMHEW